MPDSRLSPEMNTLYGTMMVYLFLLGFPLTVIWSKIEPKLINEVLLSPIKP